MPWSYFARNNRNEESFTTNSAYGVDYIKKQMEKTLPQLSFRFQKALNAAEESLKTSPTASSNPYVRRPVGETEFQTYLNRVGELIHPRELRLAVYQGGIEPGIRKVVWKHILGVYPTGFNGAQRIEYTKSKCAEYLKLKQIWTDAFVRGCLDEDVKFVTNMVRKDVHRTDRQIPFYSGERNKNVSSLYNILTTYALNHPSVGYCQGMSDLLSPLLFVIQDEGQAYLTFCSLMRRMKCNFDPTGKSITKKFLHLAEGVSYYDPELFVWLKLNKADDFLFSYRWLLLECKREFSIEDSCKVLEVIWASLPPSNTNKGQSLYEIAFGISSTSIIDTNGKQSRRCSVNELPYSKLVALRKRTSLADVFVRKYSQKECGVRGRIRSEGDRKKLRENSDELEGKKVLNLSEFYKLNSAVSEPKAPTESQDLEDTPQILDSSSAGDVSVVCKRLPPPTEFGDGNPFLMFLCISLLSQHRSVIINEKMDYQELAMHFDRLVRKQNSEKTLNMARKLFLEYLNEDWSKRIDKQNAC